MNKERLLKLAAFLDTLPKERFNFRVFADERGKPMLEALAAGSTDCGTVGCGLGWCPALFPDLIKWTPSGWFQHSTRRDVLMIKTGSTGIPAGEELFNLSEREAEYLFVPNESHLDSSATPAQLAQHIRNFVEHGHYYNLA